MQILQTILLLKLTVGCVHFASCAANYTLCGTKACTNAGTLLLNSIDKSVEPCDDIYQYVCGKWIKNHIPRNRQTVERTKPNMESIRRERVLAILNEKSKLSHTKEMEFARKLHQKCLDTNQREKDGLTSLKQRIKQIGGWPLLTLSKKLPDNIKWQYIYKKIGRYFSSASLYNMKISKTNTTYALLLTPPNIYLPYVRGSAGRIEPMDVMLTSYRKFIFNVCCELARDMKLSIDTEKLWTEIDDIINFEKKIVQARNPPQTSLISPDRRTTFTIDECQKMFDVGAVGNGNINWLEMIGNKFGVKSDSKIIVFERHYFKRLSTILEETATLTIVNYIVWHFIRSLLPYTTQKMQTVLEDAERKGKMDREHRMQACLEVPNLIYAVDYEYVKRYFKKDTKEKVLQIVRDVTIATQKNVNETTWMNTATKISFNEKVDSKLLHVGYPDLYSHVDIKHYYADFDKSAFNLTFLDSVLSVLKFDGLHDGKKLGRRINPYEWQFTGYEHEYTADYTPTSGSKGFLRLPAGTIHEVLYHQDKPEAMNYGAVGYGVGYDRIVGYGALYNLIDERNNATMAFSPAQQHMYRSMMQCFKTYYSVYVKKTAPARFSKIDNVVPFERFILDSAVISSVWRAWMQHKNLTPNFEDVRLWKLTRHTSDQLFFISIVYNLCDNTLVGSKHVRLSSSFASLPAFGKTFACKPSRMNPVRKCNVWS